MMYPYMTLADGTEIVHSHILDRDGEKSVEVHFERPIQGGFDSARCSLPSYKWIIREGYSDEEIMMFEQMLKRGSHLFFKYAEMGGVPVAKVV